MTDDKSTALIYRRAETSGKRGASSKWNEALMTKRMREGTKMASARDVRHSETGREYFKERI